MACTDPAHKVVPLDQDYEHGILQARAIAVIDTHGTPFADGEVDKLRTHMHRVDPARRAAFWPCAVCEPDEAEARVERYEAAIA